MADHQACVRGIVRARPPALVPLDTAEGRVVAADVIATCPLPAFDNSAVDGYGVASADVAAGADAVIPVESTDGGIRNVSVTLATAPGANIRFISFEVFLRPALRAAMGFDPPERQTVTRRLASPVDSRPGVHQFRLGVPGPEGTFAPLSGHRTHFLSVAARSPWLLEIPPDVTHLPAGASCALRSLD